MKRITIFALIGLLFMVSCTNDDIMNSGNTGPGHGNIRFRLKKSAYIGDINSRTESVSTGDYDKVFFYIADSDGDIMTTVHAKYNALTSEIYAEGLHEGDYNLLVLAIKGDETADRAEINEISSMDDEWLVFPSDLHKPLEAEYFYSCTPFTVSLAPSAGGSTEVISIDSEVTQDRIVGRLDFNFVYNNRYVRNATVEKRVRLAESKFYTSITGGGAFTGESDGIIDDIVLREDIPYLFMPTIAGTVLKGDIFHTSVSYLDEKTVLDFNFDQQEVLPNHAHTVSTAVKHPDDISPVMYITADAYRAGNHARILDDDEPVSVYTNRSQRTFNTAKPLQLSVTDDGRLHMRFYSPRVLYGVTLRARIAAVDDEYFDFAYFDSIPAFCDFYESSPLVENGTMCSTESGRIISVPVLDAAAIAGAEFKILSSDPYWDKLQEIKHGWTLYWGLFGGDPSREDGAPVGNWMGIRPVHCRESVAFFLNFTYMIDMDEHEAILHENAGKLYDDNKQPVKVEDVLAKMRRGQTLQVGLVYSGNGVIGLGSPTVFGAYQRGWFEHYSNRYACSVMFHELGHVMGYGHSSSFTYGPWAEELMNNFYVDNIGNMPIDSPVYLKSASNPHKYN